MSQTRIATNNEITNKYILNLYQSPHFEVEINYILCLPHLFILHCIFKLIFTFISAGANVNRATANNDHTVVSLACAGGHLAVVELLLAHGADPTHRLKVRVSASLRITLSRC